MNPLTNVKNINKLNETELAKGTVDKKSWHDLYKESAWIFIGGLAYGLTEGDILCVFSQYGEIVNINLVRDKKTGKIKGFCFLCYANQKSTILAVDNLNGIKLCSRTIRVDHVANYKPPKDNEQDDEITKMLKTEGCAPKPIKADDSTPSDEAVQKKKHKKHKKEKKKHKKRKREDPDEKFSLAKVKKEKIDEGYSKYEFPGKSKTSYGKNESSEAESSTGSSESDSTRTLRKERQEAHKYEKNRLKTDENPIRSNKSRKNKCNNHYNEQRKERASSSESDSHSNRKRKSLHASDHMNGLSSERRDLKFQTQKDGNSNSSSAEGSERHKIDHRNPNNKDRNTRNGSSRHFRRESSYGSEKDSYLKKSSRTMCMEKEHGRRDSVERGRNFHKDRKQPERDSSSECERDSYLKNTNRTMSKERDHRRRDSVERERNSSKDRKQQDPHCSYQDQRNRETPHKTDRYHNDRRNYTEKSEHFDKGRERKKDNGKHRPDKKER